jgi:nitroimidazol reductase NimA-like FMN-containing flavoprotein (pyridoxamine 5'-phosphate oxidase superfamily)
MVIHEISTEACLRVLARARLARLACARENQPYVVPVYLVHHEASGCLYGFTIPGQKVEWMRANPLVCVEVDEIAAFDQWVSVIVTGRYEELPETPGSEGARLWAPGRPRHVGKIMPPWSADSRDRQCDDEVCNDERERAWQILKTHPVWGEPGCATWAARAHHDSAERFISIYYRIQIDRVTGRQATRDARDAIPDAAPASPTGTWDWLHRTLTRVFGGR